MRDTSRSRIVHGWRDTSRSRIVHGWREISRSRIVHGWRDTSRSRIVLHWRGTSYIQTFHRNSCLYDLYLGGPLYLCGWRGDCEHKIIF